MVDSRAKGARTELVVRDILRKHTGLSWERVPGSGALDEKHGLKGDLYVPSANNLFCIEVKGYAEDHISSALLTSKSPQLSKFWEQAKRQGLQVSKEPLLIFKFDRSKVFVAWDSKTCLPNSSYPYLYFERDGDSLFIALLEDWLLAEKPKFVA